MKGIESNDKQELEKINKKINDYMYKKIKDYNAIQWGKIIKNQFIENKFFLILVDDNRDPLKSLTELAQWLVLFSGYSFLPSNKSENYARELRDLKQS